MTKDERSLLLFLETRATDHGGKVATVHMNKEDFEIAERWTAKGFVEFRRIPFHDINNKVPRPKVCTYFVTLSEEAWTAAHAERRARCKRIRSKIGWLQDLLNAA